MIACHCECSTGVGAFEKKFRENVGNPLTKHKAYAIINSEGKGCALSPKGAECGLIERICGYDLDLDTGCGDPPKRRLYHPISQVDWLETAAM